MTSLIAAIRSAVRPGMQNESVVDDNGEPDALASIDETPHVEAQTTGGDMSENQTVTGAASAAPAIPAAGAAASHEGSADGTKAVMARVNTVLSADGIKGDAARMSAAVDLMNASPDMAADAVIGFVTANVPANAAKASAGAEAEGQTYAERRASAATGLAQPAGAAGGAGAKETWGSVLADANLKRKGA